jgi:outer membrane protein OmpA-like peptidoglycan-associated protein
MRISTIIAVTIGAGLVVSGCASVSDPRAKIVKEASACQDLTVQIYFEPDSAEVSAEGLAVLNEAAAEAKPCKVGRVLVLGLADAVGAPAANLEISKRRAGAVTRALNATGLPAAEFDLAAVGQTGAVTAEGDARLLRRRADITIELSAP